MSEDFQQSFIQPNLVIANYPCPCRRGSDSYVDIDFKKMLFVFHKTVYLTVINERTCIAISHGGLSYSCIMMTSETSEPLVTHHSLNDMLLLHYLFVIANLFSQWQHSFHMKAVLPLAERLAAVSRHFNKTDFKILSLLSG